VHAVELAVPPARSGATASFGHSRPRWRPRRRQRHIRLTCCRGDALVTGIIRPLT